VGVPLSLRLSLHGGWQTPFFFVGGLGLVVVALSIYLLPPLRVHLQGPPPTQNPWRALANLLSRRLVLLSYTMTATVMMAGFIIIPNLSTYIQYNLGFERQYIDLLYMAGGAASFFTMRVAGWVVDRYGSFRAAAIACVWIILLAYFWFIHFIPGTPMVLFFVGYMVGNSFRNVAHTTLTSKVPGPTERARFMSIQSTVQHLASSIGAFLSARFLVELPDHRLVGMSTVALVSMALTALLPGLFYLVEGRVRLATSPRPA
jgi:predicted MFS family arabinose efflux permease